MIRELTLVALSVSVCGAAFGQAVASGTPTFDAASVKVNASGERPSDDSRGSQIALRSMPMRVLVGLAYQVPFDRVVGPAWLDTDGFDVVAKPGPGATRETLWTMMQNLLAERFKLVVHHDRTPVPVYALVVGKNGPRLQASAGSQALERVTDTCKADGQQMTCQSRKSTMADLAKNLPRWMSRNWFDLPIVDQTGLDGAYDFSLKWTMTRQIDDTSEASDPAFLSLFDAVQDQLGLRLERRMAPLDRVVIDRVERVPTEN